MVAIDLPQGLPPGSGVVSILRLVTYNTFGRDDVAGGARVYNAGRSIIVGGYLVEGGAGVSASVMEWDLTVLALPGRTWTGGASENLVEVRNGQVRAMPSGATTCGLIGYELSETEGLWRDLHKHIEAEIGRPVAAGGSIIALTIGEAFWELTKPILEALLAWFGRALLGWIWGSSDHQDNDFALVVDSRNPLLVRGAYGNAFSHATYMVTRFGQ